jgi:hypothetical protein
MKLNKTQIEICFIIFFSFFFLQCEKSKKTEAQKPEQIKIIEKKPILVNEFKADVLDPYLIGSWENFDSESAFMYNMSISPEGILTYSSGPFSENMQIKFENGIMVLYFVSIDGSQSFNEATNNERPTNESKKMIGTVSLKDKLLIIESSGDEYGQLVKGIYKLKKIK